MTALVDPHDPLPKYIQLAGILRRQILAGELQPRTPIPSERQLESLYGVSRITIRQAIEVLMREGLLYREHGRGTFVSPAKLQKSISELTSFSEDMRRRGLEPGQVILDLGEIEADESLRRHLDLAEGGEARLVRIERLRTGDGIPMGLQTSYILLPEGQTITRADLERQQSIYRLLSEKFHLIPTEADETLEVTVATGREAGLLQVAEGSPLLLSERTTYSQERKAIEFVKILYRGDRYRYYAKLTR